MKISSDLRSGWYPGGTYTQTCDNIGFDPDSLHLSAVCEQLNGTWNYTDIYLPANYNDYDIANLDGSLALTS